MWRKIFPYARLALGLTLTTTFAHFSSFLFSLFHESADAELITTFFIIATLFVLSFVVFYTSEQTALPSFVVAIFYGIAAQPFLAPVIAEHAVLGVLVGFGATLILFGGGLETPFRNFRKLFWKIFSLSFVGLFITAFLFSLSLNFIGGLFGLSIPVAVSILLGAVLASTDPAAIIPILRSLRFHKRFTKDIIVSESAVTDVTGTLLTLAFLGILVGGKNFQEVLSGYGSLFTAETGIILAKQIIFGVIFGMVGYILLEVLTRFKTRHEKEFEVDAAFFFFVPIFIFTITVALGGSGYLAAFIAGLLFILTEHLNETERFFNHTIDGFFKPTIFLLLGALVDIPSLFQFAGVGIVASLLFMFVIRPLAVFLTLGPFSFFGKNRLGLREMIFISFVRETGAIPAVLLVTIVSMGIPGLESLVALGMWVILATLIVEPPLTPLLAQKLGIATPIEDAQHFNVNGVDESFVLLGSRGNSYKKRLTRVADWADSHGIQRVILLHCLEDHHSDDLEDQVGREAKKEFDRINQEHEKKGMPIMQFFYIPRTGFLQDNIRQIAEQQKKNLVAIFVGRKMLDYRLNEVKKLSVPLAFIE